MNLPFGIFEVLRIFVSKISLLVSVPLLHSLSLILFGNFLPVVIIQLSNYYIEFTFSQRTKRNNDKMRMEIFALTQNISWSSACTNTQPFVPIFFSFFVLLFLIFCLLFSEFFLLLVCSKFMHVFLVESTKINTKRSNRCEFCFTEFFFVNHLKHPAAIVCMVFYASCKIPLTRVLMHPMQLD